MMKGPDVTFEDQDVNLANQPCAASHAARATVERARVGAALLAGARSRRAVLGAAALGVLGVAAACGGDESAKESGGDQPITIAKANVPAVDGEPFQGSDGRFYLVHNQDGVLALSRTCTHMGCKVPWNQSEACFHCPCHNSKFDRNGVEFAGPAKRPLALVQLSVRANGDVVVTPDKQTDRKEYDPSQAAPYPPGSA
jgi:cytochrome b6-f complex iron-sulfur subunit